MTFPSSSGKPSLSLNGSTQSIREIQAWIGSELEVRTMLHYKNNNRTSLNIKILLSERRYTRHKVSSCLQLLLLREIERWRVEEVCIKTVLWSVKCDNGKCIFKCFIKYMYAHLERSAWMSSKCSEFPVRCFGSGDVCVCLGKW